jgi:hypothetical protein
MAKIGRNDPCPCGSGKKYKKCCEPKVTGASSQTHTLTLDLTTGKVSGNLPGVIVAHPTIESEHANRFATESRENVETEVILKLTSPIPFLGQRYTMRFGDKLGYLVLNNDNVHVFLPYHVLDAHPPGRPPAYSHSVEEAIHQYNSVVDYFNNLSSIPVPKQSAKDVKQALIIWRDRSSGNELARRQYLFHGFAPEIKRDSFESVPCIDLQTILRTLRDHLFGIESATKRSLQFITSREWGQSLVEFTNGLCCVIEDAGESFFEMEEEKIRDVFIVSLTMGFPGLSVAESFAVHEKTDLRVYRPGTERFRPSVKTEFKVWNGPADTVKALKQLLAYSTGDEEWVGLIFIFRRKDIDHMYAGIRELLSTFPGITPFRLNRKMSGQRILLDASISVRGISVPLRVFLLDFGDRDYRAAGKMDNI